MTIPNLLSILRLLLVPVFVWFFRSAPDQTACYIAAGVLLVSGLTDLLDGYIARRYGLITQLGKVLDPVADKVTQATVCIMLALRDQQLVVLVVLFVLKEVLMLAGGLKLYRQSKVVNGSRWFGKLYTFVFYVVMLLVVAFPQFPPQVVHWMLWILAGFMLFSFAMYVPVFLQLNKQTKNNTK